MSGLDEAWAEAVAALPDSARLTVHRHSDEEMAARYCYRYEVNVGGMPQTEPGGLLFASYCDNDLVAALRTLTSRLREEQCQG